MRSIKNIVFILVLVCFIGGMFSCSGSGNNSNEVGKSVSPADTVFMGDLKGAFNSDLVFFSKVAPHICLMQNQYLLTISLSDAEKNGVSKGLYQRVQSEITKTNEIIKRGVMRGGDVKRIYDFQEGR